jgi:hypothetical protein
MQPSQAELLIAGTSEQLFHKHRVTSISANFPKNFEMSPMGFAGAPRKLFHEKSRKSLVRLPLIRNCKKETMYGEQSIYLPS